MTGKKRAPAKAARKPAKAAQQTPTLQKIRKAGAKGGNSVDRVALFVREYLVDLNGRQAAIRAGYSPQSARFTASELLAKTDVQETVAKAMAERGERTGITADRVLQRFWAIATADPNELIELRRCCCRYCYGKNHRYQRTPSEMAEAIAQFERDQLASEAKGMKPSSMYDEQGGTGFDPRKDPNPECPECFGEGEERTFPKDTRDLSPAGKLLYAGVKTTQHGLEIKMHDQTGMLVNVGKHLGLFKERVEFTDPDGIVERMLAARARAAREGSG
jgi:hypothetical protein